MTKAFATFAALLCLAPCLASEPVIALTPDALAQSKSTLIGKAIRVDGCIYIHHHGMQIGPCGKHDWHQITLADDPKDLLPAAFGPNKIPFGSIKARFSGRIVNLEYDWPEHGFRPTLQIDSITNVEKHEP